MKKLILKHPPPRIFNNFLEKLVCDLTQYRGVSMENLPFVEDVVDKKTPLSTISTLEMETSWVN